MATEQFANLPSTTAASGGTDAPAGGTQETWTVASSTTFPAAATGSTQFHISDPAQPSEIIAVTNVSGSTWTVTRGAEATIPVTHSAGFTIKQVVTAGFLTGLSPVSGQYLCAPSVYAPASSTTFATTSGTLSAVSTSNISTGSFLAPPSGDVVVQASLVFNSTSTDVVAFALAAHGTITPVVGNVLTFNSSSVTNELPPLLEFVVTGLSAGTSYDLDLLFAIASAGTLTVHCLGQTSTTPTGTSGVPANPVVMKVMAV